MRDAIGALHDANVAPQPPPGAIVDAQPAVKPMEFVRDDTRVHVRRIAVTTGGADRRQITPRSKFVRVPAAASADGEVLVHDLPQQGASSCSAHRTGDPSHR